MTQIVNKHLVKKNTEGSFQKNCFQRIRLGLQLFSRMVDFVFLTDLKKVVVLNYLKNDVNIYCIYKVYLSSYINKYI